MKPTLFVASSTEGRPLAGALQANLDHVADVTLWNQGVFSPGTITLDALSETAAGSDFGVFVFSPDDLLKLRGQEYRAVRDNVLFEFGLFISKLGRRRVFMLRPENSPSPLHLPSDLAGLTGATYDATKIKPGANIQAVLGPASYVIENAIRREWVEPQDLTGDLVLLLRFLGREDGQWMPQEYYVEDIALFNKAPKQADPHIALGWKRAVRYQMLCLYLQGLAEVNKVSSIMYRISDKGRKVLELLKTKPDYASIFQHELGPPKISNWGNAEVISRTPSHKLSGNDYRLLFAVYERPGTYMSVYEDAIVQPANTSLMARAKRLEDMGLIVILEKSNELDLTSKGRDLVGTIKVAADQVYGPRRGHPKDL
jgi:hypothetical protein